MSAVDAMIHCAGCGRASPWKPQYAGRKLRCKCGHIIEVRAVTAEADPEPPQIVDDHGAGDSMDDLLAAASAEAAAPASVPAASPFDVADPPPKSRPSAEAAGGDDDGAYGLAPMAAIPVTRLPADSYDPADDNGDDDDLLPARPQTRVPKGPASPVLGYKSFQRRQSTEEEEQIAAYQRKEMILPAILIAVGLLATFVEARVTIGEFNIIAMAVFVAVSTVVNLVLIFAALLIASKLLDLGLGEVGPALLKVAAVAILPSAIGGVILASTGFFGGMLAWAVSLALYFLLLYNLFEMDSQEMMITTVIIWFMRTWVAYFIIMAVLGTGGPDDEDASPQNQGGGSQWMSPGDGSGDDGDPDDGDSPMPQPGDVPPSDTPSGDTPSGDTPSGDTPPETPEKKNPDEGGDSPESGDKSPDGDESALLKPRPPARYAA